MSFSWGLRICVLTGAAMILAGCQTADRIGAMATSFETLAQETSVLARSSADVVKRIDGTLASIDEHVVDTAREIPRIAKNTSAVLKGFEDSMRQLTEVSARTIETSNATLERLGPRLEAVLARVEELTVAGNETLGALTKGTETTSEAVDQTSAALQETLADLRALMNGLAPRLAALQESIAVALQQGTTTMEELQGAVSKALGGINKALSDIEEEYTRGFRSTVGVISDEGVFLSGSGFWYPYLSDELIEFHLDIEQPADWQVISQGNGSAHDENGDGDGAVPLVVSGSGASPVRESLGQAAVGGGLEGPGEWPESVEAAWLGGALA